MWSIVQSLPSRCLPQMAQIGSSIVFAYALALRHSGESCHWLMFHLSDVGLYCCNLDELLGCGVYGAFSYHFAMTKQLMIEHERMCAVVIDNDDV